MVKRLCDKCGKEIGDNDAFIKIYAPNGDGHSQECVDLCGDCLRKFHEWMKSYSPVQQIVEEVRKETGLEKDTDIFKVSEQAAKLYSDEKKCSRALENFYDDLGLPIRAANALIRNGCFSIDDVCNLTEEELLSFKGIGKRSAEEIVTKLDEIGLKLREDEDKPVDVSGLVWN